MASGRFDLTDNNVNQWSWVVYEESSSSIAANTSNLTVWVYFRRSNNGYTSSGTMNTTVTVGGTTKTESIKFSNSGTADTLMFAKVFESIAHNADGSKTVNLSVSMSSSDTGYSGSGSVDIALNAIPRQANITSAPNFTDEENPTISYSNPAGNAVTQLMACISLTGAKDDIAYRDISKTGTSYTFNLTNAERKALRSATTGKSRTVSFFVKTVIGGTTYHSSFNRTYSIVNGNPTFTQNQISYTDTSTVKNITGNPLQIVQNQSNLSVTFTSATANKEATISKYDITINGVTKTVTTSGTVNFGKINTSSNTEISITVTDSRGNTATAKKTVEILAWALPIFTVNLKRLNNYEDTTYLTVDASVSPVNNKNTMSISYLYKESGGDYLTEEPVGIENKTQHTIQCDKNKAYIFCITVVDAFDSITNEFVLSKGKFPLFIDTRKNAVGVNDFPTEGEALCVADGVARFNDGIVLCGASKNFLITITDNGTLNITKME